MSGALDGVVVLDLTRLLPGAFCSLLLADLGADVVKVEQPGSGDYARSLGTTWADADPDVANGAFVALNRNKRSVALDLKDEADLERFHGLARRADVVLESFRPGVAERLGVDGATLARLNPRLVHCSLSGYGPDGPLAGRAGHDLNYLALAGVLALGPAAPPGAQIADLTGALFAAVGVLGALHERTRSGEGQSVDVSLAHGALSLLGPALAALARPRRDALPLHGGAACYGVYPCADGHVALGALEPRFWQAFCRGVERPDLLPHAFAGPESEERAAVAALLAGRTRAEWSAFAAEHDCCLEPVLQPEEGAALLAPHRGMLLELDQPGVPRRVEVLGPPIRLSRTPLEPLRRPAPLLGEHDAELR